MRADSVPGELVAGRSIGQSFLCREDRLSRIVVYPGTYGGGRSGRLIFHLAADMAGATDLVTREFPFEVLPDSRPFAIDFPAIADSGGRRYRFWFESPDARPGRSITFWTSTQDVYRAGTLLEDGRASSGDLRFIAETPPPSSSDTLREVFRGDLNIVENLDVRPRAWTEVPATGSAMTLVQPPNVVSRADGGDVAVRQSSPERMEVVATVARAARLVFSEKYDPGRWRARIDGIPVPVTPAHRVLCAVSLAAGRHDVVLEYEDRVVAGSAKVSAASLILALVLLTLGRRHEERTPEAA
jgi:hypothetical protein